MSARPGTVVEMHGIKATVLTHDGATPERIRCRPPQGRRQTPVIGDRVTFRVRPSGEGQLVEIAPRERTLTRPTPRRRLTVATHVARVIIVSAVDPPPRPGLIDRVLCTLADIDTDVVLVLNKVDLPGAAEARARLAAHEALGYPVVALSAHTGEGVEAFRDLLGRGLSVVMGHSGVGKSTLLNRLIPGAELATGVVNTKTSKGRHTTTVSTCHPFGERWPAGGLVVDTPGIRLFSLAGMTLQDVAAAFVDFRELEPCRFGDCIHDGEPGCAAVDAVASGALAEERLTAYRRLLDHVREEALGKR